MNRKLIYLIISLRFQFFNSARFSGREYDNTSLRNNAGRKKKGPAALSCDAAAPDRAAPRNIPPPENHRALRQFVEIGEERLVLLPHWHCHVIHLAAYRALEDAGGRHVIEPPKVVLAEQNRRVAGEFKIGVS